MIRISIVISVTTLIFTGVFGSSNMSDMLNRTNFNGFSEKYHFIMSLNDYSTNELIKLKIIEMAKSAFDDRLDGKVKVDNEEIGEQFRDILEIIIKFKDKRAIPAIVAGSSDIAWGFIDKWIVPFKNDAIPYFVQSLKEQKYYGYTMFILQRFLTSSNIILIDNEKKELRESILAGHYVKKYPFNESWLSSLVLILSPTEEELSNFNLLNPLILTLTNKLSLGYIPMNTVLIKEKRIKSKLVPVFKKGHETWVNKKITLDEKNFKASLNKSLSATKRNDLYNRRKAYLEDERQKVITELSNTLVELEKE
jgi:hypothetical protein